MPDKAKKPTVDERLKALEDQNSKLLQAVDHLNKENKALKGDNVAAEVPKVQAPTYVRAKTSSIILESEGGKKVKVSIAPRFVATGYISIRAALKPGQAETHRHTVKIDDALAKEDGKQTDFSKKCLAYILKNPKSKQWTVTNS